jgi:RNA polymerase sigma factor (sigma-70 family)
MAVTETSQAAARAVDDLYRRHGAEVYRYALAVLGNRADAEDVTQTTFLNAYRSLEQGVRPRKPSNWLLTIASNAIKQRFRQERARPHEVELDEGVAGTSPEEDGPTVGEVLTALARIPPQQRQAIVLREFEGRSYTEIAEILGITTSALETLLFRARRSLAEELEHHLTCTEAQLAVSKAADGRLGRKERRRLREHLDECPDCASFARVQRRHRGALKGLLLVPVPVSLSLFKGLEGPAAAATVPVAGVTAAATVPAAGLTVAAATTGLGGAGATGGGVLAGGIALKAAAVVTAATVATGGVVGATSAPPEKGPARAKAVTTTKPGKSAVAPGRTVVNNGVARGKGDAPGQARARGGAAPGQVKTTKPKTKPVPGAAAKNGNGVGPKPKPNGAAGANHPPARDKPESTNQGGSTSNRPTQGTRSRGAPAAKSEPRPEKPVKPASTGQGNGQGQVNGQGNGKPTAP